jgi:plastocyanin
MKNFIERRAGGLLAEIHPARSGRIGRRIMGLNCEESRKPSGDHMKLYWSLGIAAVTFLSVSALAYRFAGAGSKETAEQQPRTASTVTIQLFQFKPGNIEVEPGMKVTWVNQDDIRHSVTSGVPEKKDGRFGAALAGKGQSFSFTFLQPGNYPYFCDRHEHMRGEIRVK